MTCDNWSHDLYSSSCSRLGAAGMVLQGAGSSGTAADIHWDDPHNHSALHEPLLAAARAAATKSSWQAVLQHTRECTALLKQTTSKSKSMTEVLMLEAEAASQLELYQEAIEVSVCRVTCNIAKQLLQCISSCSTGYWYRQHTAADFSTVSTPICLCACSVMQGNLSTVKGEDSEQHSAVLFVQWSQAAYNCC